MMRINDQLILEEDYDENYQPTEEGEIFYVFCIVLVLSCG